MTELGDFARIIPQLPICFLQGRNPVSFSRGLGFKALARLQLLSQGWREILPTQQLRDIAARCLQTHALQSADSLQLVPALVWCDHRPSRRQFICAARRLAFAAKSVGFTLLQISIAAP